MGDAGGFGGLHAEAAQNSFGVRGVGVLAEFSSQHEVDDPDEGAAAGVQRDLGVGDVEAAGGDAGAQVAAGILAHDGLDHPVRHLQAHDQPAPVGIAANCPQEMAMGDADALGGILHVALTDLQEPKLLAEGLGEGGREDVVLGGEVVVERAGGGIGAVGDVRDRRAFEPLRGKQLPRCPNEAGAGVRLPSCVAVDGLWALADGHRGFEHDRHHTEYILTLEVFFRSLYAGAMRGDEVAAPDVDVDVAIVGFGPVGQALAALLGAAGHRAAVFERQSEIYRLPRAVHLDHEAMRLLQNLGVAGQLADELLPVREYHWFGADGEPLMTLGSAAPAVSGWEPDYMFFQPALEAALVGRVDELPTVSVERGWAATGLTQNDDGVTLLLRRVSKTDAGTVEPTAQERLVRARWVIGADGANSYVRETLGITRRDLGFQERWLVVDVEPIDMEAIDLPSACQWCDPRRPITHIQSGTRHRRWEFMLLPGETAEDFADESRVRALIAPWFGPDDGRLTRHAVYEFRSMLADRMRVGRALIVGDAAHLTPPFLGQGLCSGLRDVTNLAWKLDLVLRGAASEALLDTVDAERQPQNEWVIAFAVALGQALCELDPDKAIERDTMLRAADTPPPLAMAPLGEGFLRSVAGDEVDPLAGHLAVQGRVAGAAGEGLLDELTGNGFTLIAQGGNLRAAVDADRLAALERLGVALVSLDEAQPGGVRDLDGRTGAWLDEHGVHAVLVRPDFYAFGTAVAPTALPALIDDLLDQLSATVPATP